MQNKLEYNFKNLYVNYLIIINLAIRK